MLALIVPLSLVSNSTRCVLLVFFTNALGTEILDTMAHEASGVVTFVVVIAVLFALAGRPRFQEAFE